MARVRAAASNVLLLFFLEPSANSDCTCRGVHRVDAHVVLVVRVGVSKTNNHQYTCYTNADQSEDDVHLDFYQNHNV